jgi:flavodoxin
VANERSPRILVVFFSHGGVTRRLADSIARATRADCEELRERRPRRGLFGWLRTHYQAAFRRAAEPLPLRSDPTRYDIVFIGTPTWNGAASSPVRAFLRQQSSRLPAVVLFATCERHGAESAITEMADIIGKTPLATLALTNHDVRHGPAMWAGEFAERALLTWSSAPSSA